MEKIKCPECGSEIDENMKFCPNCGHKMNPDQENKKKNGKKGRKKLVAGIIVAGVAAASVGIFFATSNMRAYNKANQLYSQKKYAEAAKAYQNANTYKDSAKRAAEAEAKATYYEAKQLYQDKKYAEAAKKFNQINYKDSKEMADKSTHLDAVQHDKNAPVISGIDDGSSIDVTCGTTFNLKDYLKDKIKIEDDVTEDITDYKISGDSDVYDAKTGDIDTQNYGTFDMKVSAEDEAKNKASLTLKLNLNPVHITAENRTPVVYDGEYGKITVKSARHGKEYDSYGDEGYFITFDVQNNSDSDMLVYLPSNTSINDYQIQTYHTMSGVINPGNRGTIENMIYEKDIPSEDVGNYTQIDTWACLSEGEMEDAYYNIPIIIDANI